ncbi:hypothetical protein LJB42_003969 [Komagataella kurtzmanii]|nr:hypothetical protein LJB42_003969 [Komagataella kurtzmanii]
MITHRSNNVQYEVTPPSVEEDLGPQFEFYWTRQKDPHSIRRKLILAKHPEVAKLCGPEWRTKYIASAVVLLQLSIAYALKNTPVLSFKFLALAYVVGATANQNCFLCIHELSHNLAFRKPLHNKLFAIWVNLPIGVPYSASFQPYHQLHHKFLGDEVLDTDLPTPLEATVLSSLLGKAFFATFQIFFYALRPMMVTSIDMTFIHLLNVLVCLVSDFILIKFGSANSLWYLILSSFFAGSLHPTAGHFIAEHYLLDPPKHYTQFQDVPPLETYSYYGMLNFFTWNVGYHNEHHDFPFIAWSKLPLLRTIAHDFYQPLPKHTSWVRVIVDFIFDENVLMYNRVKRETAKDKSVDSKTTKTQT